MVIPMGIPLLLPNGLSHPVTTLDKGAMVAQVAPSLSGLGLQGLKFKPLRVENNLDTMCIQHPGRHRDGSGVWEGNMVCCLDPEAEYDVPMPPDDNDIMATLLPLSWKMKIQLKKQIGRFGTGCDG